MTSLHGWRFNQRLKEPTHEYIFEQGSHLNAFHPERHIRLHLNKEWRINLTDPRLHHLCIDITTVIMQCDMGWHDGTAFKTCHM